MSAQMSYAVITKEDTEWLAAPSWGPEGASAPSSVSVSNRRAYPRLDARECEWLRSARIKYGPEVQVIDISAGGFSFETNQALRLQSTVVFELTGIEFLNADQSAVQKLIDSKRK